MNPEIGTEAKSRLDRLLAVAMAHRLFLAFVLVGKERLSPLMVMNLTWAQVDLINGHLMGDDAVVAMPEPLIDLMYWHAARQRWDRNQAVSWGHSERVFLDEVGVPYLMVDADTVLARLCRDLGYPPVTLTGLRHPIWN